MKKGLNQEQLSDALQFLHDDILEETDRLRANAGARLPRIYARRLAAAACLALVVLAGISMRTQFRITDTAREPREDAGNNPTDGSVRLPGKDGERPSEPDASKEPHGNPGQSPRGDAGNAPQELPLLTVDEWTGYDGSTGTVQAYDIAELVNANPWSETATPDTLPVYKNNLFFDEECADFRGADPDEMRAFLLDTAQKLGLDADALTVADNSPDEETKQEITEKYEMNGERVPDGYFDPTALTAQADGVRIDVDLTMTATITFTPARALPQEYPFTYESSCGELTAVADYLREEYAALIDMERPVTNISGGDYDIYRSQSFSLSFFDGSGSIAEQLVNYNFNRILFYGGEDGTLDLIRICRLNSREMTGEYPVITADEAAQLLKDGHYFTNVSGGLPDDCEIVKTELIYRDGPAQTYLMPYYRFYADLTAYGQPQDDGIKTYGMYDVPAVDPAYISSLPERQSENGGDRD